MISAMPEARIVPPGAETSRDKGVTAAELHSRFQRFKDQDRENTKKIKEVAVAKRLAAKAAKDAEPAAQSGQVRKRPAAAAAAAAADPTATASPPKMVASPPKMVASPPKGAVSAKPKSAAAKAKAQGKPKTQKRKSPKAASPRVARETTIVRLATSYFRSAQRHIATLVLRYVNI
jgi:hypothetical protein